MQMYLLLQLLVTFYWCHLQAVCACTLLMQYRKDKQLHNRLHSLITSLRQILSATQPTCLNFIKKNRASSIILPHIQRQNNLFISIILFEDVVFPCVFCILNCYGEESWHSQQAVQIANSKKNLRFQQVLNEICV